MPLATRAQSAGKSSVLTQLSGVKLPQKSERCTRVATNLKLRRGKEVSLSICLKRPNNEATETVDDVSDTAVAIDELQATAIEESGGREFAFGYLIEVSVTGPRMPDATLVDLPGFATSSDEDTKLVVDIVTPYLQMENTVILHVCKGDTDYDSLLGNDVIREYSDKVIHVFTFFDRLAEEAQTSVMATILHRTHVPRFVIRGNFEGDSAQDLRELQRLPALKSFEEHFQYGPHGQLRLRATVAVAHARALGNQQERQSVWI